MTEDTEAPRPTGRPVAGFTFVEEDLMQLARGVVPEWLRFDADAALDEELSK